MDDKRRWVFKTPHSRFADGRGHRAPCRRPGREETGVHRLQQRAGRDFLGGSREAAKSTASSWWARRASRPRTPRPWRRPSSWSGRRRTRWWWGRPARRPRCRPGATRARLPGKIYFNHGVANNDFLRVCGAACEGAWVPVGPVMVAGLLPDSHPVKASAQAFAAKYEAVHGAGSVSLFAAYTWDVALLLQQAVPVALKAARPGTPIPRGAARRAGKCENLPTATGVVNMSPADHNGGRARPGHGDGCGRQVARAVEGRRAAGDQPAGRSRTSRALACPPCARKRSRFCMLSVLPDKHSGGRGMTGYNRAVAGTGRFRRWLAGGLLALAGGAACAQVPGLPPAVVRPGRKPSCRTAPCPWWCRRWAARAWWRSTPRAAQSRLGHEAGDHLGGPVRAGAQLRLAHRIHDRAGRPADAKGALSGPLYLRAGGDPQFLMQDLWVLLRELRLRGVKQINDLVIDRSIFGQVGTDPAPSTARPTAPTTPARTRSWWDSAPCA